MMGQRRKDRELFWHGVLQRQTDSGLNVAAFCRQESISAASFYAWRRKLKERDAPGAREAPGENSGWNFGGQLLPVRIESASSSGSVRVLLPQGVSIDAPSSIDRGALVDLLGALREAQLC